jgi:hypothetical protein
MQMSKIGTNFPPSMEVQTTSATAFSGSFSPTIRALTASAGVMMTRVAMYVDFNGDGIFAASESLALWAWDGQADISLSAGAVYNFFYMAAEGGGGQSNNWYLTQPGGSEERVNFGKASQLGFWSAPTGGGDSIMLTTGQNVSKQVDAVRNPTSWTASGLPTGLSITNAGVITGSSSTLGVYNATVTAINSDGNDSKSFKIFMTKGDRTINWSQTFSGIVYGDSPISLTGTATGGGQDGSDITTPLTEITATTTNVQYNHPALDVLDGATGYKILHSRWSGRRVDPFPWYFLDQQDIHHFG